MPTEARRHPRLIVATEQGDRVPQFLHVAPAHVLGRPQRLLGGRGIAVQDVAGAGDLQHDGGKSVSDEVVDVAGDPPPFLEQRLLGELTPGGVQLGRQFALAGGQAAEPQGKAMPMIQMPTAISDGSWSRLAAIGESAASRPRARGNGE